MCENFQKPWITIAQYWENLIHFRQLESIGDWDSSRLGFTLFEITDSRFWSVSRFPLLLRCSPWGVSTENLCVRILFSFVNPELQVSSHSLPYSLTPSVLNTVRSSQTLFSCSTISPKEKHDGKMSLLCISFFGWSLMLSHL